MNTKKGLPAVGVVAAAALLAVASAAVAQPTTQMNFTARFDSLRTNPQRLSDSTRLYRLFALTWEYGMHEFPEWATYEGYEGQNDRWTDDSQAAMDRRRKETRQVIAVLDAIDREKLRSADRLNYDLFRDNYQGYIDGERFPSHLMPINQRGGVQQDVAETIGVMPTSNVKDYENILARLRAVPDLIRQTMDWMKQGAEKGITPPKVTLRDVPGQIVSLISGEPIDGPILRPFKEFPESISADDQKRLRGEAVSIFTGQIVPAYKELHAYLMKRYIPSARTTIGVSALPDGQAWYAHRVRRSTTTDMTPQQIHDLGLSEVKRIRGEMEKIIAQTGFNGDFAAFCEFLRTDPRFFYTDSLSLLQGYRDIAKRADAELVKLFGKLPRLPYGVIAVPGYMAKSQTTAYYWSGSLKAGRPGYFYANTYDLKSRPKWEMEALTLHEAVPGHHLQIAIAQEMEEMPEFRKDGGYTAYVEGWGLYSESLGEEMGFYQDPYSKFGQLTYEMWRAIRLVVDTGIHSFGWTREQAITYFRDNSSKTQHDIEVEVDRYIVWPGQAVAYKIGELKIKELRAWAKGQLGDRFDIRAFHDRVLGNGAIPLDVLDRQIRDWVAEVQAQAKRS